jgi:FkbM family methyltransferase
VNDFSIEKHEGTGDYSPPAPPIGRNMKEHWKAGVAKAFTPFIPLVRAVVRYGPASVRKRVWHQIGRTRLVGLPHSFSIGTEHGRFTGNSSDLLSRCVYYLGHWEPDITHLMRQRLRPGDTFVDVGANTGWFTLLAADAVGPSGRVVSIEASPTTFLELKKNVATNRLTNVRLVNEAVWSSASFLSFFQGPPSHSGVSTVVPTFAKSRHCTLATQVPARPLPDLLTADEIASMRIIKIDVEGAERDVLLGLEAMLDTVPDNLEIFLELNPTEYDVGLLLRPLRNRGFRVWLIPDQYQSGYCLNYSAPDREEVFEELLEAPNQQVNVLVSRTHPQYSTRNRC